MSKFSEMVRAVDEREERNARVITFIDNFVARFISYCQIPPQNIKVLPWIEKVQAFQAKSNEMFSIPQAIDYDAENDIWRIGVCIVVKGTLTSPRLAVTGGMIFKEWDSQFFVRFGNEKPLQLIDLNVQPQCEAVFNGMVKEAIECLQGKRSNDAKLGFRTQIG